MPYHSQRTVCVTGCLTVQFCIVLPPARLHFSLALPEACSPHFCPISPFRLFLGRPLSLRHCGVHCSILGPTFSGRNPQIWTTVYKPGSLVNMWQCLVWVPCGDRRTRCSKKDRTAADNMYNGRADIPTGGRNSNVPCRFMKRRITTDGGWCWHIIHA